MIVFWLLVGLATLISGIGAIWRRRGNPSALVATPQADIRLALSLWFIAAGILHFTATKIEMLMMPAFLPFKVALMYISGAAEILGGIGLLIPRSQRAAGLGLVALLLAVFPANINAAVNNITGPGLINDRAQQWIRLPLQFVLIALVLWACELLASPAEPESRGAS